MTTPSRRDLLSRFGSDTHAWLDRQAPDTRNDDETETDRRRNHLDAIRRYDPSATLVEELTVRLSGDAAGSGALDFEVGDALLKPLEKGVSAVRGRPVKLAVTGLSEGSTVIHVRATPEPADTVSDPDKIPVDTSEVDLAVRDLLALVNALDTGQPLDRFTRFVADLEDLVKALDRLDLDMALGWHAFDGQTRSARLGEAGRSRFAELMRTRPETGTRTVSGRVTELREAGVFKVKSPGAPNSPAYEVRAEPDELLDMHLQLGDTVHVLVTEERQVDRTGSVRSTSYRFIRHVGTTETLDEATSDDDHPSPS